MIKILIVEDDTFLQNAYKAKFPKLGIDIDIATDGNEAIEYLSKNTPNAILLDLIMPRKDGFAVLEEIKKHPDWSKIPIIVASNLGQKEDIDRAMSLGARGYVVKSDISVDQIANKLKDVAHER